MATLTGELISETYDALLKVSDNQTITGVKKRITDGFGNETPLLISSTDIEIDGNLILSDLVNASTDTDKFLVLDTTTVKYRTGSQLLSDIGGQGSITLTTTGTSGASTLIGNTLNIPNYSGGGITSLSTIGTSPNAFGATISGTQLNLEPASASFGGVVTTLAQTFAGNKTLTGALIGTTGSFASSGGSDTFSISHSSGSGIALNISKGGNGEGIYVNKTSGSGNAVTIIGTLNATTLVKSGGTSSQFLKADGTVDSTAYGTGSVTSVAALTLGTTGTDLSSTVANGTTTPVITLNVPTASATNRGALSSTDWTTFNGKQNAITLTTTGSSGAATFISNTLNVPTYTLSGLGGVPTTRTITINGTSQDLSADRTFSVGTVTSVGLSMPPAFSVASSPITGSGTIAVTAAGLSSQYIRGDGQLADFPTSGGGGGSSVSYYLNGSVNKGTFGGNTYYEMNKVPVFGAGTDFSIAADGYISQFITDANDPNALLIPAGNWNFETYFSASSSGGTPSFYVELYKYNGTTFTLIASNSATPELISFGTTISPYFSALAVPETVLLATDRLAVRVYVNVSGRTITLHTENSHLCQVVTTFTTGIQALNGLTKQTQYFAVGTSGSNFNISSVNDTHTFNLPNADSSARGVVSTGTQSFSGVKTFLNNIKASDQFYIREQNALTLLANHTAVQANNTYFAFTNGAGTGNAVFTYNGSHNYTLPGATGTIALVGGAGVGTVTSVAALTLGTSGTDLSSTVANSTTTPVITLNVPTASATNRGALSSADWSTFNSKEPALTKGNLTEATSSVLTITGGTSSVIGSGTSIQVKQSSSTISGFLSSTDWSTFNSKQGAITLTTTGTSGAATLIGNTLNIPQYSGGGGTITLAAIGSTPNANGATLTGTVLNLEPASILFGGVITTGAQNIAGDKNFMSSVGAPSFTATGSTAPTNGMYLSAANTLSFATNSTNRFSISSTGAATFGAGITTGGANIFNASGARAIDSTSLSVQFASQAATHSVIFGDKNSRLFSLFTPSGAATMSIRNHNTSTDMLTFVAAGQATFASSATATAFIPSAATIPTNGMYLSATNTLDFATNSTNRLSISSGGAATFSGVTRIGSGGTALGKFSVNDGTNINLSIKVGQTDATAVMLNAYNDDASANIPLEFRASKFIFTNADVGIGITTPQLSAAGRRVLDINGTSTSLIALSSGGSYKSYLFNDGTNLTIESASLILSTSFTDRLVISGAGVVKIGNLAGAGSRTVTADASGNLSAASDSRLKQEDLEHKIEGLSEILKIQPRAYKWLSDIENKGENAATEIGFFANEVCEIIPSAAPKGNDGYYGFYDRAVIAALVNSVKELNARIIQLEN